VENDTEYLKTIAGEIAADPAKNNAEKADTHLEKEAERLEKAIVNRLGSIENFTQRDTFYFNTLSKLVNICDSLYGAAGTITPNVQVLLNLMQTLKNVLPDELRPGLKLPKAFVQVLKPGLIEAWTGYRLVMTALGIPDKLLDIAAIPFRRFTDGKQMLYWGDYTWLRGYQSKLDIMDWEYADCNSPAEALVSLLIGRDFNDDRFYIYCKKYIQDRMKLVIGKRNRLLELAVCEKLVLNDTQVGVPSFDLRANTVSARLQKWIKEEIDFVETHERDQPYAKFEFKWNVEMIAFFFKLLHERNVFGKVPLERFAETIAANCSSVGKEDIQPATILNRFYMKDLNVIKALEALLVDLLEIIRKYLR